jgi:hypothetical protein
MAQLLAHTQHPVIDSRCLPVCDGLTLQTLDYCVWRLFDARCTRASLFSKKKEKGLTKYHLSHFFFR